MSDESDDRPVGPDPAATGGSGDEGNLDDGERVGLRGSAAAAPGSGGGMGAPSGESDEEELAGGHEEADPGG